MGNSKVKQQQEKEDNKGIKLEEEVKDGIGGENLTPGGDIKEQQQQQKQQSKRENDRHRLETKRFELMQQQAKLTEQQQSKSHVKPEDLIKIAKKKQENVSLLQTLESELKKIADLEKESGKPEYVVVKRAYPGPALNQHNRSKFTVIDPFTILANEKRKQQQLRGQQKVEQQQKQQQQEPSSPSKNTRMLIEG